MTNTNTEVKAFFDDLTFTLTYIVFDPNTKDAVIIDPVLDYDPAGSKLATQASDKVLEFVRGNELKVHYVLETHAHADHLTGAQYVKEKLAHVKVAIGERITDVQETFKDIYNFSDEEFHIDGRQFDLLFKDGEVVEAGSLKIKVLFTR